MNTDESIIKFLNIFAHLCSSVDIYPFTRFDVVKARSN